ncbi:hypothetical protein ACFVZN_29610 [Streptomyces virginiae]|uniref:hypothetical protein n=1 Tax=Streptomyces virginiae TaxID=1961 RepID=UPI003696CB4D
MADTIAKTGCVEECCGAVDVTIRREMERVLLTDWHNPLNEDFSQAEQLEGRLTAGDPRATAQVWGGSQEAAEKLGYRWPPEYPWDS